MGCRVDGLLMQVQIAVEGLRFAILTKIKTSASWTAPGKLTLPLPPTNGILCTAVILVARLPQGVQKPTRRLPCAESALSRKRRLTLNVLLSFVQFEREVTAEPIRDKIAASKRKASCALHKSPARHS